MENDKLNVKEQFFASLVAQGGDKDTLKPKGVYHVQCFGADGKLKWEDTIDNVITDVGANQLLDSAFGSGPIAGPFLGLISSVGYSTPPAVGNTMASHTGWNEAGNGVNYPNWSTPASNARASISFSVAATRKKSMSSPASFTFATNGGTVKGMFIVMGTGAVATNNSTAGVLLSAGLFSQGDKPVTPGDIINASYELTLN